MQIYEITRLNENVLGTALGAAASGAASALGVSGDVSGAFGSIGGGPAASGYGDARRKAAAAAAKSSIEAMAKREMQSWNTAVADLVKQKQVQDAKQLDTSSKMKLRRDLFNRLHKVFMQGRLGNNYIQALPTSVDKLRQPEAKDLVNRLTLEARDIMNFNKPSSSPEEQLKQWQTLSQTAYDAMSLTQFYPATSRARAGAVTGPMPKILGPAVNGSFNIGNDPVGKLKTSDPTDNLIISKISTELAATPGRNPEIKSATDGSITIGSQRLDPTKPDEERAIQRIMSIVTGAP